MTVPVPPGEQPSLENLASLPSEAAANGFVGRQREMGELTAALEDALAGRGRLVTLAGEPGVGKTRTAREFASYAATGSSTVLWGRCYEGIGMPSYWPWVQAVTAYVRQRDPEGLRLELDSGASDIAQIVPEVWQRLHGLEPSPSLNSLEQARFRLFDSMAGFLNRASRHDPVVLILDNLHWADTPSLLLLEFLVTELRESRVMLLGTYRDEELSQQHPLSRVLGELIKERHFHRISLKSLDRAEVGSLIQLLAGTTPEPNLVEAVYSKTQGNPLFVTEVVRMLLQQGGPMPQRRWEGFEGSLGIPEGVKGAIGQRLYRLSDSCNRVLTVASVVGREFDLDPLELLMPDLSGEDILGLLEEAIKSRIVEELPSGVGRYQFSHVLVQETLASRLSGTRRARLHREIGETLEELHADDLEAHATELAHHFAQAGPGIGQEKLVRYLLMAGERALAGYAYEHALDHFRRGLEAREVPPEGRVVAQDAQAAAMLFGLGRAQVAMADRFQLQQAIDSLHRAFDYYARSGDVDRAVAVAEYPYFFSAGAPTGMAQLIGHALDLVPPDSHQAGRLLPRYGFVLGLEEGDQQGAQEAFDQALAIARGTQDAGLELRTLVDAAVVARYQRRFEHSLEKSLRAIEVARYVDDLRSEVAVRYEAALALEVLGDPQAARHHAARMLERAEQLRVRSWVGTALYQLASLYAAQGDWTMARHFGDRGLIIWPTDYRILTRRSLLEYETGNFNEGDAYLERLLELMRGYPRGPTTPYMYPAFVVSAVSSVTGGTGRLEIGENAARTVLASSSATHVIATFARAGLGLAAVQRGDAPSAAELHATLGSERGTMLVGGLGATDRVLGLLARTAGGMDEAIQHFQDALTFCRKAGYLAELAWTCCDYADTLRQRNGARDRGQAMALLDEATHLATELGMAPLLDRINRGGAIVRSATDAAACYPAGLSGREVEVLRLLAAGKSNRDIAAELVLSVRTVERHISNIYGKTGCHGRVEATSFAFAHRLVSSS